MRMQSVLPAIILSTALYSHGSSADQEAADRILVNGEVHTPKGWAAALAIRDGVIVAVGSSAEINAMRGTDTVVHDLDGAAVFPGLHDMHVHPIMGGLAQQRCLIPQELPLVEIQAHVAACVEAVAPGEWIQGGQWDAPAIGQVPTRAMLDTVAPDNPVVLIDTSGHSLWANSMALEMAGITRDTRDPKGGIIERDAAGEPTGVFREDAKQLVEAHVPLPTEAEVTRALEWSVQTMLSHGITTFTDAFIGVSGNPEAEMRAYAALADRGVLKQRTQLCIAWTEGNAAAESLIESRNLYARERLSPDCIKLFLDGVPTDSHTAAMLEPYAGKVDGHRQSSGNTGLLLIEPDTLNDAVTRFDAQGLTVKFHAAGDGAVRAGLDAVRAARANNGFSTQLHTIGHNTFAHPDDIAAAQAAAAVFEVSPYLWSPSSIVNAIHSAVADERMDRAWPMRDMLDAGTLVIPGSDWSVVPSVNPWIGLETIVSRRVAGEAEGEQFAGGQAVTLKEAFDIFTVNSARQLGNADVTGRIAPGMLADIIVVEDNPFRVPLHEVHSTRVRMTFIEGEQVYEAGP